MKFHDISKHNHKNYRIVSAPIESSYLTFDELYSDISDHWEDKARRLQARRWRMLKHQEI